MVDDPVAVAVIGPVIGDLGIGVGHVTGIETVKARHVKMASRMESVLLIAFTEVIARMSWIAVSKAMYSVHLGASSLALAAIAGKTRFTSSVVEMLLIENWIMLATIV